MPALSVGRIDNVLANGLTSPLLEDQGQIALEKRRLCAALKPETGSQLKAGTAHGTDRRLTHGTSDLEVGRGCLAAAAGDHMPVQNFPIRVQTLSYEGLDRSGAAGCKQNSKGRGAYLASRPIVRSRSMPMFSGRLGTASAENVSAKQASARHFSAQPAASACAGKPWSRGLGRNAGVEDELGASLG